MVETAAQNIDLIKAAKSYAVLKEKVESAGILKRSYLYYYLLIIFSLGGFFVSLVGVYFSRSFLPLVVSCLFLTAFSVQIGGLVHDGGHRAVFKSTKANDILGYICSAFVLTVYDSWKITHNAHHANPNKVDEDPDMEIPFIAYNKESYSRKKGFEKALVRYQAYLYYPILSLSALSLRAGRIIYYRDFKWNMWWHFIIFITSFVLWFIVPFFVFDLGKAIFFLVFENFTMGIYMSNIFAPNHKGMPQIKKGDKFSFLEMQIITSRNIKSGFFTDFFILGLNYQIEHHLFPHCPRNKLRLITPYVKAICRQLKLEYTEVSFVKSNKIILSELNSVGVALG